MDDVSFEAFALSAGWCYPEELNPFESILTEESVV